MRKAILLLIVFAYALFVLHACNKQAGSSSEIDSIMTADRQYSAMSEEQGMNAAFLAMFADSGVILRKNRLPVEGRIEINKLLLAQADSSFSLSWKPMRAFVAKSNDLGYSYGTYKMTSKPGNQLLGEGTYVTIWKKDPEGIWKAMLDTGNPGLSEPEKDSID